MNNKPLPKFEDTLPVEETNTSSLPAFDDSLPLEENNNASPSNVAALALGGLQGASFGFADEIEAGLRAPFSDRNYEEIRDEIRQRYQASADAHPMTALAGELVGGVLVPGLGSLKAFKTLTNASKLNALVKKAPVLEKVLKYVKSPVTKNMSSTDKLLKYGAKYAAPAATIGAAENALYELGQSAEIEDADLIDAAQSGAVFGGALGMLNPAYRSARIWTKNRIKNQSVLPETILKPIEAYMDSYKSGKAKLSRHASHELTDEISQAAKNLTVKFKDELDNQTSKRDKALSGKQILIKDVRKQFIQMYKEAEALNPEMRKKVTEQLETEFQNLTGSTLFPTLSKQIADEIDLIKKTADKSDRKTVTQNVQATIRQRSDLAEKLQEKLDELKALEKEELTPEIKATINALKNDINNITSQATKTDTYMASNLGDTAEEVRKQAEIQRAQALENIKKEQNIYDLNKMSGLDLYKSYKNLETYGEGVDRLTREHIKKTSSPLRKMGASGESEKAIADLNSLLNANELMKDRLNGVVKKLQNDVSSGNITQYEADAVAGLYNGGLVDSHKLENFIRVYSQPNIAGDTARSLFKDAVTHLKSSKIPELIKLADSLRYTIENSASRFRTQQYRTSSTGFTTTGGAAPGIFGKITAQGASVLGALEKKAEKTLDALATGADKAINKISSSVLKRGDDVANELEKTSPVKATYVRELLHQLRNNKTAIAQNIMAQQPWIRELFKEEDINE